MLPYLKRNGVIRLKQKEYMEYRPLGEEIERIRKGKNIPLRVFDEMVFLVEVINALSKEIVNCVFRI